MTASKAAGTVPEAADVPDHHDVGLRAGWPIIGAATFPVSAGLPQCNFDGC
jgi:hypothetical protein